MKLEIVTHKTLSWRVLHAHDDAALLLQITGLFLFAPHITENSVLYVHKPATTEQIFTSLHLSHVTEDPQ